MAVEVLTFLTVVTVNVSAAMARALAHWTGSQPNDANDANDAPSSPPIVASLTASTATSQHPFWSPPARLRPLRRPAPSWCCAWPLPSSSSCGLVIFRRSLLTTAFTDSLLHHPHTLEVCIQPSETLITPCVIEPDRLCNLILSYLLLHPPLSALLCCQSPHRCRSRPIAASSYPRHGT